MIFHFFRKFGKHEHNPIAFKKSLQVQVIDTEFCFNIEMEQILSSSEFEILRWLLAETFEPENFSKDSFLEKNLSSITTLQGSNLKIVEVGPRMNFTTAWSTNAVTICHLCGLKSIKRIERSTRFLFSYPNEQAIQHFIDEIHDRMTECVYSQPLTTFKTEIRPQPVQSVPLLENGLSALSSINKELGLAFDEQDMLMYCKLFQTLQRNPTTVELFDLSQSNSEHSRHWFFRGRLVIDGKEVPDSLMTIVKQTLTSPNNSIVAFCDNSSGIQGYKIKVILPSQPGYSSSLIEQEKLYHILFTAETHNFPTGVAPKPGAETGIGGRIRDVHAIGKGGLVIGGTAAYCVGNLNIPNYNLPWEDKSFNYPDNLASPLKIEIEASNGASDYGNKFGEPLIQGFTRSFGLKLGNGERWEWIKPIMFTGGVGQFDDLHKHKDKPKKGMLVVKIGGPAYRIGFGGGSASSLVQGENEAKLDFNAVQRGDAEMEQKLNRVIKACIEMGPNNPIISIHDQGAGGSGNVLKEIVEPEGARIELRKMIIGDETLSVMEIWGAEYQENDALLIEAHHKDLFQHICDRERLPVAFVGEVTGDGKIVVYDSLDNSTPVNLELEKILGKMPPKIFYSESIPQKLTPLHLPSTLTVKEALERVLRLVSVGSKSFLTNKVDRSVSGLIAQQQSVGPLHLPLSDVSVVAQTFFGVSGAAISIGEQPIKGFISYSAMARLTVGEAITNLVWAYISSLKDVKCSGNWMWAAKLPGEAAAMYETAIAMRDIMLQLGIAIDGGKDSLSMAARVPKSDGTFETVKAPGTLVVSTYVTSPDITKVATPDIKFAGQSNIYYIDLGQGKFRLGGSALAHVFQQIGNLSPDVDDIELLKSSFEVIQILIRDQLIQTGHDVSDGGLIITLLEMAFAGNCGLNISLNEAWFSSISPSSSSLISFLFAEELGLVFEVQNVQESKVQSTLQQYKIPYHILGSTTTQKNIQISLQSKDKTQVIFQDNMPALRDIWNETSYQLELRQAAPSCVEKERKNLLISSGIKYHFTYTPEPTPYSSQKPKVAILREEGSNGDREMAAAFYFAGFDPWDVSTSDLLSQRITLDQFSGIAFVGGFSFADVLNSGKGWAGVIRFHKEVWNQFQKFYNRPDTFTLGVCNGCQLMALLGWVPFSGLSDIAQPRFVHNASGRFESRFSVVTILPSPAIMLKGMEDSTLGIWAAHGEGQTYFPQQEILTQVLNQNLAPIRYVDDNLQISEEYPHNPNGSPFGIAALCSSDGRHLAVMPHPERSFLSWQWPYLPPATKQTWNQTQHKLSPWIKMFQNARLFCERKHHQ